MLTNLGVKKQKLVKLIEEEKFQKERMRAYADQYPDEYISTVINRFLEVTEEGGQLMNDLSGGALGKFLK